MSVQRDWVKCDSCGVSVQDTVAMKSGWRHAGPVPGGKDWCPQCRGTMPPHIMKNEHTGLVQLLPPHEGRK